MGRDGVARIKLAPEGPSWHSHLGGSHAILTISVVDRVLQAACWARLGRLDADCVGWTQVVLVEHTMGACTSCVEGTQSVSD